MSNLQTYNPESKDNNSANIITEYDPKFCQLLIDYASTNINPDGFWGQYKIDESLKEYWMKTYPDFKQAVSLVPHLTANYLNKSFALVMAKTIQMNDHKSQVQILLKMMDMQNKIDKDTGMNKRREADLKTSKQKDLGTISDIDVELGESYLDENI